MLVSLLHVYLTTWYVFIPSQNHILAHRWLKMHPLTLRELSFALKIGQIWQKLGLRQFVCMGVHFTANISSCLFGFSCMNHPHWDSWSGMQREVRQLLKNKPEHIDTKLRWEHTIVQNRQEAGPHRGSLYYLKFLTHTLSIQCSPWCKCHTRTWLGLTFWSF